MFLAMNAATARVLNYFVGEGRDDAAEMIQLAADGYEPASVLEEVGCDADESDHAIAMTIHVCDEPGFLPVFLETWLEDECTDHNIDPSEDGTDLLGGLIFDCDIDWYLIARLLLEEKPNGDSRTYLDNLVESVTVAIS